MWSGKAIALSEKGAPSPLHLCDDLCDFIISSQGRAVPVSEGSRLFQMTYEGPFQPENSASQHLQIHGREARSLPTFPSAEGTALPFCLRRVLKPSSLLIHLFVLSSAY